MNIKIFTAVLLLTSTSACGSGQASFAKAGEPGGLKEPGSSAPVSTKGVATGLYEQDGEKLSFSHAVVLRQDDAEKMSMTGPGLRVLLSDVEVGAEALGRHGLSAGHHAGAGGQGSRDNAGLRSGET